MGGPRMKRILVRTDFSTPSLAALPQAIHYTQAVGGDLLLLHVVEDAPLRWYAADGFPESPSAWLEPTAQLVLPQPPQTRVARDLCAEAAWKLAAWLPPHRTAFAPWSRWARPRRRSSASRARREPTCSSWGRTAAGASGAGCGGASRIRSAVRRPPPC